MLASQRGWGRPAWGGGGEWRAEPRHPEPPSHYAKADILTALLAAAAVALAALAALAAADAWAAALESSALTYAFVALLAALAVFSQLDAGSALDSGSARQLDGAAPRRPSDAAPARSPTGDAAPACSPTGGPRRWATTDLPGQQGGGELADRRGMPSTPPPDPPGDATSALLPVWSEAGALAPFASLACPRPAGCGSRHACPDLGRGWVPCEQHGRHPAPRMGSVWSERIPEGEPGAGALRLCLSWVGAVLDASDVARCRGWDDELAQLALALMGSGGQLAGACSAGERFPALDRLGELATMDARVALWWRAWQRRQSGGRAPLEDEPPGGGGG